jgi:hypothetical protein
MDKERFHKIQDDAENLKQEYLEANMLPILQEAFRELCEWVPNRKIVVLFGMGTSSLTIQRKARYSYTPLYDSYGSLNCYEDLPSDFVARYGDTPLLKFIFVLDHMTDSTGNALCFSDMTHDQLARANQPPLWE